MRHIRQRRRFKLILVLLLALSVVLLLETRIESFAPQLNNFAELRIEEAFNNKIIVSIGGLEGGIIHPLVLNDCKIMDYNGKEILPLFQINSVRTNYRLWDYLFKRKAKPCVDVKLRTQDKEISGFMRFEGDIDQAHLKGYINLFDKDRIDFTGDIKKGELALNFKINHLKLYGFDVVSDAFIRSSFIKNPDDTKKGYIEGAFEAKNLILNYKPFMDLKASYRVSDSEVDIMDLSFGSGFKGYGSIGLKRPYDTDIVLTADNTNLGLILSSFNVQNIVPLSGIMNGRFTLKGPISDSKFDAEIELRKGNIGVLDFERLNARLKGEGPIIRIEDSRITRQSGYFALAGDIDLRKIGKGNIFEDVKMITDDRAITWDEWDEVKIQDVQEVKMIKKMSEEVNLGFKKFVTDERVDESLRDTDEVELEYKLHPKESLKMSISQDKNFWGVEHKDKF